MAGWLPLIAPVIVWWLRREWKLYRRVMNAKVN